MPELFVGDVLHVVPPDDREAYDLEEGLRELAAERYVLVCREGGRPSWFERIRTFVTRQPIRPVTLVTDEPATEGEEISVRIEETEMAGVYRVRR